MKFNFNSKLAHTIKRSLSNNSLVRTEVINIETNINIGYIYLSDELKLNALTVEMGKQFKDAVDNMISLSKNQSIRACLVTGDGQAFSAGGDLEWLHQRHYQSPHIPTIAVINGAAIGAGLCMTLACDIRIANENAKLGFTFPKLGIHPGMGASVLLPRLINQEIATHLLLSGDIISGKTANKHGLVLETSDKDNLNHRALEIALSYSKNSPIAVQSTVQTLRSTKFDGLETGLLREANAQSIAYPSPDFLLGLEAVKTKSTAKFNGW